MRAVQITRFGGPEVLEVVELAEPAAADGQRLYDVSTAGVNYADTHHRRSAQRTLRELRPARPPPVSTSNWRACWSACWGGPGTAGQPGRSSFARSLASVGWMDDAAQLARKVSACCEGEPGSAVKVMRVWPGSAARANPS